MKRPLPITVIGWYFLVSAPLSLAFMALSASAMPDAWQLWRDMGLRPELMLPLLVASTVLTAGAGWLVLQGDVRGRHLIVALFALQLIWQGVALTWLAVPITVRTAAVALLPMVVALIFLFSDAAQAFFRGEWVPEAIAPQLAAYRKERQSRGDLTRVVAIPVMACGGFILVMALLMGLALVPVFQEIRAESHMAPFMAGIATVPLVLALGVSLLGVLLWGPRRWQATAGFILLGAGCFAWLSGLSTGMFDSPEFQQAMIRSNPDMARAFDSGLMPKIAEAMELGGWVGLAIGLLGGWMVYRRWGRDRAEVSAVIAMESE